jgi:mRNA interferase MazF
MTRSQIWLVNLEPTVGAEMTKVRPAVIVSADSVGKLDLKVIVPLTEWKPHFAVAPWMVRIDPDASNGLARSSAADAFQVRCISQDRFIRPLGALPEKTMQEIGRALVVVLDISP